MTKPVTAVRMARRLTADGVAVELWSDGPVTGRMGFALSGVPVARPSAAGLSTALAAGWLLMGEVELYDAEEVGGLYEACRWAAARGLGPGEVRARAAALKITPNWEVLSADRDGRPTERVWRLPRLGRWAGLAVWDRCGASQRYEVMSCDRDGVCMPTGFAFGRLADLSAHLLAVA